jgi:hypothetical protein
VGKSAGPAHARPIETDAAFLLRVQVYEILQILLQEGRTHAWNRDTIAVAELNHRVAMDVGSDRGSQFLHIMNVSELVKLDRVVLRIEVVDRLRAFARVEHKGVVAGAANGDGGRIDVAEAGGSKMIVPPCPSDALSKLQKSKWSIVIVWPSVFIVMMASPLASSEKQTVASRNTTQIDFI